MDLDLRPIAAAVAGYLVILGTLGVVVALYGRGRRRKLAWLAVPLVLWILFAGIPFLTPPLVGAARVVTLAGLLCVGAGALFATVYARARKALAVARTATPVPTSAAMATLQSSPGSQVTVEGRIEGDPPLVAPLSGAACLGYRVEVFRRGVSGEDLVGLEDHACDRLVIADAAGRLALAVDPAGLRAVGAPVRETGIEGSYAAHGGDRRLAQVVGQLDSRSAQEGVHYRAVERAVPTGERASAVGRVVRRAGEPVLVPQLAAPVAVRFGPPQDVTAGLRRLTTACGAFAAVAVLAGFTLLALSRPGPDVDRASAAVEEESP